MALHSNKEYCYIRSVVSKNYICSMLTLRPVNSRETFYSKVLTSFATLPRKSHSESTFFFSNVEIQFKKKLSIHLAIKTINYLKLFTKVGSHIETIYICYLKLILWILQQNQYIRLMSSLHLKRLLKCPAKCVNCEKQNICLRIP